MSYSPLTIFTVMWLHLSFCEELSYSSFKYQLLRCKLHPWHSQRLCHFCSWTQKTKCQYNFTLQIRLDQFTSGSSKTKNSQSPKHRQTGLSSSVFKHINIKTNYLLIFVLLHLGNTDFKAAAVHKSPRVLASCRAGLITIVYNPIPDRHCGSFFYLPWKVKLTFFSSF